MSCSLAELPKFGVERAGESRTDVLLVVLLVLVGMGGSPFPDDDDEEE